MGKTAPARLSISAPVRASFVHVSSGTAPGAVSMLHALQPLPEHEQRGPGEDEDVDVQSDDNDDNDDDNDDDGDGMARHASDLAAPPPAAATTATSTSPTFSTLADPVHPHESLLDRRRRRLDERAHLHLQQQQHHHLPPQPPPLALATSPPHAAPLLLAGAPTLAPPTTATTPTSATHHRRHRSRGSMMLLFSPTKPRASGLGNADASDSDSDDAVRARLRSVISAPVAVAASSNPGAVPLGPTVHAPAPRSPIAAGLLARQRTLLDESSDSDEAADNDAAARLRALARVGITVTPPPGNGIPAPPPPTPAMLSPATQKKRKSPGVFRMLARTLADGFSSATRSSSSSTRGGTLPRSGPPDPSTPASIRGSFDLAEEPRRVSISSPHLVAATARTVLAGVVPLAEAALRQQTTGFASLPRSTPPPPPGTPQRPRAAHPPPSPALRRRSMSFSDLPRLDAPHSVVRAASPARNAAHAVSAASPLVHVVEVDGEDDSAPLPPRPPSRTSARTVPVGARSRTPSGPRAAASPPPMPPPAVAVPPVPPMSPTTTTTATAHVTAVAVPVPAPLPRSRSPAAASRSRASTMPDADAALDAAWLPPAHVTKRISLTPKLIADSDPGIDGGENWRLPSWIGADLDALAAGVGAATGGSSKRSLSRSRSSVVSAARSSLPPVDVPTVAADGDTDAPPPTSPAAAAPPQGADDVSRLESLMARTVDEERAMLASFISSSTPAMGGAPPTPPPEPVPKDLPPPPRRAASPSPPRAATSPSAGTKPRTLRDLLSAVAADVPGTLKRARSAGKGSKRASKESAAAAAAAAVPVLEPSSPKPAQEATMDLIAAYAGLCDESPAAETAPAVEPVKEKDGGEEVDPEVAHLVAQIHRAMRDLDEDAPARSTVGSGSSRMPVAAGP
ncbi:hypothetical protein GGF32_001646 [Allomyces javanicus]|nr:hypothetical protein GGF32_001646 [Allomyces javanicus]